MAATETETVAATATVAATVAVAVAVAIMPSGCAGHAEQAMRMRVVSRGTLAYGAAWSGDRLVTVELTERFELVVRRGDRLREIARIDLGPPEDDLPVLAVIGDHAFVGGDDGWIRDVDLATGAEVARWPHGAPITALAADADHVVAGDASGVVCVRLRPRGELLQCAVQDAVRRAVIDDGAVVVDDRRLALPTLADIGSTEDALTWRGGSIDRRTATWTGPRGARPLASFHGAPRAIAIAPRGWLVIAGWVKRLDQPSVVVWTAPPE